LGEWEEGTKDMLKVVGENGGEWAGAWEEGMSRMFSGRMKRGKW